MVALIAASLVLAPGKPFASCEEVTKPEASDAPWPSCRPAFLPSPKRKLVELPIGSLRLAIR